MSSMDLDKRSEMITFKSFLVTFKASIIFLGHSGCGKNWLDFKSKTPLQILTKLSLPRSVKCTWGRQSQLKNKFWTTTTTTTTTTILLGSISKQGNENRWEIVWKKIFSSSFRQKNVFFAKHSSLAFSPKYLWGCNKEGCSC